ncbi:granulocyte-macrophage colony-stimulating factor receptor subunit alpha-like isoform X3 [Loxodonta africana]|uniref:granulocyte-macrophage colony-stimulating factor receptor subunit alpha-like isoform X3 n=1 Tax=Loxodonta africana TaxID=9785 RepID=UPI0030D525B2
MGPLGMALLFSVLLTPTGLLAQGHQGLSTQEPVPRLHVTFDPREMTLAWDCRENATVVKCLMSHREEGQISMKPIDKQCSCTFELRSLHRGVVLTVEANTSQGLFEQELLYDNPGENGTAAENFSCFIYDEDFMNCTWAKGRAAPDDVQYFFYIRDSEGKKERECPHYLEHSGTHVGCLVEDLSELAFHSYFLVNGTSRRVGIQFFDSVLSRHKMNMYSPPTNITTNCNHSHCLLEWQRPRAQQNVPASELMYEVDIRQKISIPGNSGNKHNFPINPRASYTVQIRTANSRILHWGPWSEPVKFGFEEQESSPTYVYVLVVLGTLLGALVIGFLFKRFLLTHNLFPPIPKIKDKLNDNQQTNLQVSWDQLTSDAGKAENEDVLTVVEEVV